MEKKNSLFLIIGAVALVALIIIGSLIYKKLTAEYTPQITPDITAPSGSLTSGSSSTDSKDSESSEVPPVPDFSFADFEQNTVNFNDFLGKPIILNFWASWCTFCVQEMPDFDEMYDKYGSEINFIMLNVTDGNRETFDKAKSFIENKGFTFPVYYDTELNGSAVFGASSLPMTFFMDADGIPLTYANGMINKEILQNVIDAMLQDSAESTSSENASSGIVPKDPVKTKNPSWCSADPVYTKITAEDAHRMISELDGYNYTLIDVRTASEFEKGHIENAINIFGDTISETATDVLPVDCGVIFIYGADDTDSETAAKALVELNYNHVYDFGKLSDWTLLNNEN